VPAAVVWGTLSAMNAAVAGLIGAAIGAASGVMAQVVIARNNARLARDTRREDRRTELREAIRDFLAEAQLQEKAAIYHYQQHQVPPDADTHDLWLRQKMVDVLTSNQDLRQTCHAYSESLDHIIFEGVIGNVWVEMRKTRVPFLDAARAALDAS